MYVLFFYYFHWCYLPVTIKVHKLDLYVGDTRRGRNGVRDREKHWPRGSTSRQMLSTKGLETGKIFMFLLQWLQEKQFIRLQQQLTTRKLLLGDTDRHTGMAGNDLSNTVCSGRKSEQRAAMSNGYNRGGPSCWRRYGFWLLSKLLTNFREKMISLSLFYKKLL